VQPGEVAWHFILPQSVLLLNGPEPVNVFDTLTVTFQSAGQVTLTTGFGPPSTAHAYVFTPTDDTLLAGSSTIGRRQTAPLQAGNDPQFNLSQTCASTSPPTTTTTSTTTTTTIESSLDVWGAQSQQPLALLVVRAVLELGIEHVGTGEVDPALVVKRT
jgi:hypothetical protein